MTRSSQIRVAVIGAGSWGTTVAAIASVNTPTTLWARRAELADQINNAHVNADYLASEEKRLQEQGKMQLIKEEVDEDDIAAVGAIIGASFGTTFP